MRRSDEPFARLALGSMLGVYIAPTAWKAEYLRHRLSPGPHDGIIREVSCTGSAPEAAAARLPDTPLGAGGSGIPAMPFVLGCSLHTKKRKRHVFNVGRTAKQLTLDASEFL
jgi:hypothetical protein